MNFYFPQAEAFFQEKDSGKKEFPAPGLTQAGQHFASFCPIPLLHMQRSPPQQGPRSLWKLLQVFVPWCLSPPF